MKTTQQRIAEIKMRIVDNGKRSAEEVQGWIDEWVSQDVPEDVIYLRLICAQSK